MASAATRVLSEIRIYPVKSLAGISVPEAFVEPWGLRDDRRWVVVDASGAVLTAREERRMLGVTAAPDGKGGLRLTGPAGERLDVAAPTDGPSLPVAVSRLDSVRAAGGEADAWLSQQLARPVKLGWLDDPRRRTVSQSHGGRPGDYLSLADAGPLLLTTNASLRRLNDWVAATPEAQDGEPQSMVMLRFRPNVVVEGKDEPFAEDEWASVRVGDVDFRLGEQCDRCMMTMIDPTTRELGKEPLRSLARNRQWDHKTWFGIRVIPTSTGHIRVGDSVAAPYI